MIEFTRKLTGMAKKLDGLTDAVEVIDWARAQDGIAFTVAARADGSLLMQAEGVEIATVYPQLGQWLVFDGAKFEALSDEEFTARGYVAS